LSYLLTTGISSSNSYRFRIRAKNKYDWGDYSPVVSILAAVAPDPPTTLTTAQNNLFSQVTWSASDNHGDTITSYEILVKNKAGLSFSASTTCSGSQSSIVFARSCTIAYSELRSATFGTLILGDEVVVKVRAKNSIAWGAYSGESSGGDLVKTEPLSPPVALTEGSLTDDSQIQVNYSALTGTDTGFDTITAYKIWWDNGSAAANWLLLATETSPTYTHTTMTGVSRGASYQFKY
jgi:hypothetical protein